MPRNTRPRHLFPHDGPKGGGDLSGFAFMLMVVCLCTMIYMSVKFWGSDVQFEHELAFFAIIQVCFIVTGITWFLIKNKGLNFREATGGYFFFTIIFFFVLVVAAIGVEYLITGLLERSSINTMELVFFYIFAGTAEESFFRYFMIGMPLYYSMNKPVVGSVVTVISVGGSSVAFALSHVYAYGDQPLIMVAQVIVAAIWGSYYAWTLHMQKNGGRSMPRGRSLPIGPPQNASDKPWRQLDLLAVMLAHMMKNFAAVPAVLASLTP